MAEKPSELKNNIDRLDPVSTVAGAGSDAYLQQSGENYPSTEEERRETVTNTGDQPEETEQIKAQIEETRNQLGETIDAIQEKLSFANVSEQVSEQVSNAIETAKDTIYDATIGKAVNFMKKAGDGISNSGAVKTIQSNPLPLVLIGLGAGLLAYQSFSRNSSSKTTGSRYRSPKNVYEQPGESRSMIKSARRSLSSASGRAYDNLSGAASTAYEGVSGALSNAYSGTGDLANRAYEAAGEYKTYAVEKYDHYIEENPLAVGAVAVALGAAVGFAIPSTRYEGQFMGEARQNVLQKAQDVAGEYIDRAKQAAEEAGQTIKNELA